MATTAQILPVVPAWLELAKRLQTQSRWAAEEGPIEMRQTHISTVLLGRQHVLKLKKPVDFGFLDYTSPEKRLHCCQAEVRLNRRLCPDVYLGVAELVAEQGVPQVHLDPGSSGAGGPVLDHGVWMRRLPDSGMLNNLLARGEVTEQMIDRVAERLSRFHMEAQSGRATDVWGSPAEIAHNWRENFEQAEPFAGKTIDTADLDYLRLWVDDWMAAHQSLLEQRVRDGYVVDGHGDVRAESICVDGSGIHIYDCIEFNDRFRCGDTASEVAFLAMDLHTLGRPDLSYYFTECYAAHSADHGLWRLLPFYRCYRAFVRGKVASFVTAEREFTQAQTRRAADRASHLFALARRYARPSGRPALVVAVSGLSGTGKTSVARALAAELGVRVHSSDAARKALFGSEKRSTGYGAGAYTKEATEATYRRLILEGASELTAQGGVILDATFLDARDIEAARDMARQHGARFRRIDCRLDASLVEARLKRRAERHEGLSDANWEIYLRQLQRPLPPADQATLALDTAAPIAETAQTAVAWLDEQEALDQARAGKL